MSGVGAGAGMDAAAAAALVAAALVVATAVVARRAVVASRFGSRRPIRAGTHVRLRLPAFPPRRQTGADVAAALEAIARSLRSGAGLHAAIADGSHAVTGIVGAELQDVATKTARGQPLVDALAEWRRASSVPGVRLAVAALTVAADIGGPQAAAVDGVAMTLRQRVAAQAEAWALGGQARLSAAVIGLAPLAFGFLASAADPQHAAFLLRTPVGLAMLATGLALDAAGALWMIRLARIGAP